MKIFVAAALAAAAIATPGSGAAQESGQSLVRMTSGFTYFNRTGANLDQHNASLRDCMAKAAAIVTMDEAVNGAGLFASWSRPGPVAAAAENCMVVRGWRVVRLDDAEGAALAKLPAEQLSQRLAAWVGEATPHGQVARVWNNEAARASVKRYEVRAWASDKASLSLALLKDEKVEATKPAAMPPGFKLDKSWPLKPLKPADIAAAPAKAAVLVFGVKGISLSNGVALSFARIGADNDPAPALTDKAPDFATVTGRWGKKDGAFTILALPPGKWRITSLGVMPVLSLCLGAPAFEVKAGDVVYAGMFDLGSEALGPDLALEPVKAHLAGQPAAETIRPASYVNGSTGLCTGAGLYALEVPGAPFEPGYTAGSAAGR